ncbi:hypothetical protein G7054_g13117 [Neopestalotiopsis clavispora]|nr:hypothetical protein G7054_g13117 [Neopestalotiopsis clavispora]
MMPAASVQRRRWNLKAIRFGDPSRADVARQSAHTAVHRPPLLTYLVMYWTDMDFSTQMGLFEALRGGAHAINDFRKQFYAAPGSADSGFAGCQRWNMFQRSRPRRTNDNVAPVGSLRGKKDPVHKLTKPSGHWSFFEGKVLEPDYHITNC